LPLVIAHVDNDLHPSAVLYSWWAHYHQPLTNTANQLISLVIMCMHMLCVCGCYKHRLWSIST